MAALMSINTSQSFVLGVNKINVLLRWPFDNGGITSLSLNTSIHTSVSMNNVPLMTRYTSSCHWHKWALLAVAPSLLMGSAWQLDPCQVIT